MLAAGTVLYVGFLGLFLWRCVSGWRLFGAWLEYANYCMLLYLLLFVLNTWAIVNFVTLAMEPEGHEVWQHSPSWLRMFTVLAPPAAVFTLVMAFIQTGQHVNELRRGSGVSKHDRAVQIIALPAVFGCMAMNALATSYEAAAKFHDDAKHPSLIQASLFSPLYNVTPPATASSNRKQFYLAQTETFFHVGDIYEAWALFQFSKMTMEMLKVSLQKISTTRSVEDGERQDLARGLLKAHSAFESITWVGVAMFLVVTLGQAGWSIYLLNFTDTDSNWFGYNSQMGHFFAAGMVASMAAIYNVHTVEMEFHDFFEGYGPLLKFLTVKLLLSLAYFQKGAVSVMQAVNQTLPQLMQNITGKIPLLKDLINFDDNEFYIFYSSLVLYECILGVLLHYFAWPADESFYSVELLEEEEDASATKGEKESLLANQKC
eukprot:TRINITY_DN31801_c0_g1_i1.p1 TRINITY_DN31801_c0_g1~~TRINITY_DN31801_c0_g1_i1.p1  ORF type:complete len:431 (-),score=82.03 TRINITY_DN31801_c0_g1_i1:38-1330(-)